MKTKKILIFIFLLFGVVFNLHAASVGKIPRTFYGTWGSEHIDRLEDGEIYSDVKITTKRKPFQGTGMYQISQADDGTYVQARYYANGRYTESGFGYAYVSGGIQLTRSQSSGKWTSNNGFVRHTSNATVTVLDTGYTFTDSTVTRTHFFNKTLITTYRENNSNAYGSSVDYKISGAKSNGKESLPKPTIHTYRPSANFVLFAH